MRLCAMISEIKGQIMDKKQIGQRGEAKAAAALIGAGYEIIERNWRCPIGEIDLIARHRSELVFIEVRSRAAGIDTAFESISPRKRDRMVRLAYAYLDSQPPETPFRIDAVAISGNNVEIIENATSW